MSRIDQVFGTPRVFLPVIHPVSRAAALQGIRVVQSAGARGVFLIDQGMQENEVLSLVREVRDHFPMLWVGVNLLSRRPAEALEVALDACDGRIDGIWSDDALIDERLSTQRSAEEFVAVRCARRWTGLYFGGVAFKYQREVAVDDLGRASSLATTYMDVICTSGPGTGHAVNIKKLRAMSAGAGDTAIALASGVTAANVHVYLPYAQAFLVGTGIEAEFGVLDENKIVSLLREMSSPTGKSAQ